MSAELIGAGVDAAHVGDPPNEVAEVLDRQRQSFLAAGPPSLALRRDRLDRMVLLLASCADELADALDTDFGH